MVVSLVALGITPGARVSEVNARAASGHHASRAAGSPRDVSGNAGRLTRCPKAPSRSKRWTTTNAVSSNSNPHGRQNNQPRSVVPHAIGISTETHPAVGSEFSKAVEENVRGETVFQHVSVKTIEETIDEDEIELKEIYLSRVKLEMEKQLVTLPTGDAVAPWWTHGSDLQNVIDVASAEEFVERMTEARVLSEKQKTKKVIVVEYLAGWCFACRSLHPKISKIASNEFPDVLFLRVRKEEAPALCDAMGIDKLPYVQIHTVGGDDEDVSSSKNKNSSNILNMVDAFPMNLTAPKLKKFRSGLRQHRGNDTRKAQWQKSE